LYADLRLEEADIVLHFGWGLGYSGVVLTERLKPDARVFVLEPDADVFELFRAEGV
jgi:predicted O-methyltransferase YrrM